MALWFFLVFIFFINLFTICKIYMCTEKKREAFVIKTNFKNLKNMKNGPNDRS
jgi:hypothetical protein